MVVGWYNENGVVLTTDIVNEITTTVNLSGNAFADYAKVFVWENFASMRPLCRCEIVPFE